MIRALSVAITLAVALVASSWGPLEARSAPATCPGVVKIERISIPIKTIDRHGSALFELKGKVGGPASGRIVMVLASSKSGSADTTRTEFRVSGATVRGGKSAVEFNITGTAVEQIAGVPSSRPFSATLSVAGNGSIPSTCYINWDNGGITAEDDWETPVAFTDGDTWKISGLMTCVMRARQFTCS